MPLIKKYTKPRLLWLIFILFLGIWSLALTKWSIQLSLTRVDEKLIPKSHTVQQPPKHIKNRKIVTIYKRRKKRPSFRKKRKVTWKNWSEILHDANSFADIGELPMDNEPIRYSESPKLKLSPRKRILISDLASLAENRKVAKYIFSDKNLKTCTKGYVSFLTNATISTCSSILVDGPIKKSLLLQNDFEVFKSFDRSNYCDSRFFDWQKVLEEVGPKTTPNSFTVEDVFYKPPEILAEKVIIVHAEKLLVANFKWGHGFQHFLKDVLPLLVLSHDLLKEDPYIRVLMNVMSGSPVEKMMDHLGFPRSRILAVKRMPPQSASLYSQYPKYVYHADELYLPKCFPGPQYSGRFPADLYSQHRQLFTHKKYGMLLKHCKYIIVVSRGGGHNNERHISNEEALLAQLKVKFPKYKVVLFVGSKSSLSDTIKLFEKARLVIGPHGGGFYNIYACRKGTGIIELVPDGYGLKEVSSFAKKLRLQYIGLVKNRMNKAEHFGEAPIKWIISIAELLISTNGDPSSLAYPFGWRLSDYTSLRNRNDMI